MPYKREGLAIEAFRRLGRRLVVAGDGPLRARLEAGAPPNVEFTGRLSDEELADLYARCRAVVYPQEEDFGIVAVEAQAAGRPVIAFARGGAVDSVVPLTDEPQDPAQPATGLWFDEPTSEGLASAVARFERIEPGLDTAAIRAWAERFAPERFRRELADAVERTLAQLSRS